MTDNLGTAGGKAPAPNKQPEEGGTPRTGFDSAPKSDQMLFEALHGHGGSRKGAH